MTSDASTWVDRRLRDRLGDVVGVVVDVYDDPATSQPAWLAVATGFFGIRIGCVPIHGATPLGDDIVVPHDRTTIEAAPRVSVTVAVTAADHGGLSRHYALGPGSRT